ncbi:hypothetical protein C8R47DRAFT_1093056 [Mycena vitilis]|nr:hypothetical protein C8R47DRAFT_1093056 [Mycena vitilis]
MSTYAVKVSPANEGEKKQLEDFFTFCGQIEKIDFSDKEATIHFTKSSAAKTALMLDGGTLDGKQLSVKHLDGQDHKDEPDTGSNEPVHNIEQSDKPRSAVAAEWVAKGYKLSDSVFTQAIELDNKHGISSRFASYWRNLDTSAGNKIIGADQTISGKVTETLNSATQQARSIDEQKGYSKIASDYYCKALTLPGAERVRAFYTSTSKQALDIHEEAMRIKQKADEEEAAAKAGKAPETAAPTTA